MGNLDNYPEYRNMQERWHQEQLWEAEQERHEEDLEEEDKKNKIKVDKKDKLIHNIYMCIKKLYQNLSHDRKK